MDDPRVCLADGFLLGMTGWDVGHNCFIGTRYDLLRNVRGAAQAAGLTEEEAAKLLALCP